MKIISLKKMSIPKIAVLATGAIAALLVATVGQAPAQASPSYATACSACHALGGSVTATPSTATVAPGAAYTVALVFTGGSSPVGYWISGNGASVNASNAGPASMTAPAAAGSYTYTVWMRSGTSATTTYSITVAAAPTTTTTTVPPTTTTTTVPPPTTTTTMTPSTTTPTVPPTTTTPPVLPSTTTPPVPPTTTTTTVPPTTTTTTVPPTTTTTTTTTEPPTSTTTTTTTEPPTSTTTTEPPTSTTTTTPPASIARIRSLSPSHGVVGTKVKIRGTNFGTSGVVKFGNVTAKVSSWTNTAIVVKVPNSAFSVSSKNATVPVWYRHDNTVSVTVTPKGAAASNAVRFSLDSRHGHGHGHGAGHSDD